MSYFRVDHYVNVTSQDDNALKVALYNHGPIAVDIDAAHESLSFYRFVIFTKNNNLYKNVKNLIITVLAFGMMRVALQLFWIMLS